VVGEYKGYYKNQGDALAAASVSDGSMKKTFVVEVDSGDGDFEVYSYFERLSEAAQRMEELLSGSVFAAVRIRNAVTDVVVDERSNENYVVGEDDYDEDTDYAEDSEEVFSIVGVHRDGSTVPLGGGYETVEDALRDAIEYVDYKEIRIVNGNGDIVKTIS
jgi:hypothetical protein